MVWATLTKMQDTFDYQQYCVPPLQLEAAMAKTQIEHMSYLSISSRPPILRLSGIICALGNSSSQPKIIQELIENGMNIACFDFAHEGCEYYAEILTHVRKCIEKFSSKMTLPCPVGIAVATKGPIIRNRFPQQGNSVELILYPKDIVEVTGDIDYAFECDNPNIVYIDYPNLHNVMKIGKQIIIGSKRITLECKTIIGTLLTCEVVQGGCLISGKKVYFPGTPIDVPTLSHKDMTVLRFAIDNKVDIIFASCIRSAAAIEDIRNFLGPEGSDMKIIAKIQDQQGLKNIDTILEVSDGVAVGRMCYEMDEEEVFLAQKCIVSKCNAHGKPAICTNELLESMVRRRTPTRAERTDVANAVLDGTDCIMLGRETTMGDHPVQSLQYAAAMCKEAEAAVWQKQLVADLTNEISPPVITIHALISSAVIISLKLFAAAIVVISSSLKSAQLLTQYRPKCPVIAVTRNVRNAKQAHLYRGIVPVIYKKEKHVDWQKDAQARVYYGINFGRKQGFIRAGDPVIVLTCTRQGAGFTDKMKIVYVTNEISHGVECTC